MAITQRSAPTTITALDHAFAATADTAVTSIHLCNITSSDATIDVYLLPSDGSTTVPTENNKIYNSLTIGTFARAACCTNCTIAEMLATICEHYRSLGCRKQTMHHGFTANLYN